MCLPPLWVVPRLVCNAHNGDKTENEIDRPYATSGHAPRRRRALGVYKRDNAHEHGNHPGPCSCASAKSGGRALKQERTGPSSDSVTSQWHAMEAVLTKLRVQHATWAPYRHHSRGSS
eukprot:scaffold22572_cov66-Phaeocystis_antarctica.AAC.1